MDKTILYIVADSRSGSTLLENILSKSPDIISVGELYHLKEHLDKTGPGHIWDWKCSCGEEFTDCPFWTKVFHELYKDGINEISSTIIVENPSLFSKIFRYKYLLENEANKRVIQLLESIYKAIFKIYSPNVIVDSSKNPAQGYCLYKELGYRVKIIYLKRNISAVALSKKRWWKKMEG